VTLPLPILFFSGPSAPPTVLFQPHILASVGDFPSGKELDVSVCVVLEALKRDLQALQREGSVLVALEVRWMGGE